MIKPKKFSTYLPLIIITVIATMLNIIIITKQNHVILSYFNDLPFHLSRTMSLANIMDSPVNFNYFNEFGIPMGLAYPWLFLVPFYILIQWTNAPALSYYLFFYIVTIATLLIAYWSVKQITKKTLPAYIFMLCYTFAFYRTADIYNRHAMPEAIAMMFFPLVLYGVYSIIFEQTKHWLPLSLGMTGLCYTHFLSLFLACLFVGLILLCNIKRWTKTMGIAFGKATVLSILLSLPVLSGFIILSSHNHLAMPTTYDLSKTALSLKQLLWGSVTNTLVRDQISFGCFPFLMAIISIITLKKQPAFIRQMTIFGLLFLWMTTKLFPWGLFQHTPLQMIQFPWRFLILATLCFSLSFAYIIPTIWNLQAIIILMVIMMIGHIIIILEQPHQTAITNQRLNEVIATPTYNHVGKYDYAPYKVIQQTKDRAVSLVNRNSVDSQITHNGSILKMTLITQKKTTIDLPVFYYTMTKVKDNHHDIPIHESHNGRIQFTLPKGRHHIQVQTDYPPFYKLSIIIALITMISVILCCII